MYRSQLNEVFVNKMFGSDQLKEKKEMNMNKFFQCFIIALHDYEEQGLLFRYNIFKYL